MKYQTYKDCWIYILFYIMKRNIFFTLLPVNLLTREILNSTFLKEIVYYFDDFDIETLHSVRCFSYTEI